MRESERCAFAEGGRAATDLAWRSIRDDTPEARRRQSTGAGIHEVTVRLHEAGNDASIEQLFSGEPSFMRRVPPRTDASHYWRLQRELGPLAAWAERVAAECFGDA